MEAWVAVIFGTIAGCAVARLHAIFDGGWLLSIPLGAVGGLAGQALFTAYFSGLLDDNVLAGTAVAAVAGGAIAGALSGPLRTVGIPALVSLLGRGKAPREHA